MKEKSKNKALIKNATIIKELNKEIENDYRDLIKKKLKNKLIQIRKTEKLLKMQKKEIEDILSGKIKYSEEDLLFGGE